MAVFGRGSMRDKNKVCVLLDLFFDMLDLFFVTLRSLLDHHAPLLTKTNKSSRIAPTPWITPEVLSLNPLDAGSRLTYFAQSSNAAGSLLTDCTIYECSSL